LNKYLQLRPHFIALFGFAAFGLAIAVPASALPEFQFKFTEKPGMYAVGLRVIEQYDAYRVFETASDKAGKPAAEGPRPMQTLMWYPAEKSSGKLMTLADYAALIKTETSFGRPVERGKPQAFVEQYMLGASALPALAIRDAAMQVGRFPVVIYAPSLNAPAIENIELCEYLASHGFVVIATPSMGAKSREMTIDIDGANAEARDISFLIDFAKKLPDTNMAEVAAMGYSWGGMSALFAAARDQRIGALISLDASFRYSPGTVQEAGDVHPDRMAIPLLVFSRAEETLESWDTMRQKNNQGEPAPNVLNEWTHGDLVHIRLLAVSHIQFSSLYQRSERFRNEALQFSPADYSLEEGAESYNWMTRYSLEFLNAYLKQDVAAKLFLQRTPAENGVPRHLIAASFRPASGKPSLSGAPPAK
jgi:pimeloyl-ACP methyl ester carboxylesterase